MFPLRRASTVVAIGVVCSVAIVAGGQQAATPGPVSAPRAELVSAPSLELPGEVDSNSPAVWERLEGRRQLIVFTSFGGWPSRQAGPRLTRLGGAQPVAFDPAPLHGAWMEALLQDTAGTLYGYYHNEIADVCFANRKVLPHIGAARSRDGGVTWEDLGAILKAPDGSLDCASRNTYFVGGLGDFSVVLDEDRTYAYIFYSSYLRQTVFQGVAVARLQWADRDEPRGKVEVWRDGVWLPAAAEQDEDGETLTWRYPEPSPIYATKGSWHAASSLESFWGPSVHWNTYLRQWVMLLNRATSGTFQPQGIYIAFGPSLENPRTWSTPQRLISGGRWYPQVIGLEAGRGTDKLASQTARFFMGGHSDFQIQFFRPGELVVEP